MLSSKQKITLAVLLSILPLSYFLFPFLCGFFNLPQEWLMLMVLVFLFGPIVVAVLFAAMMPDASKISRVGISFLVWIITMMLFFIFPAGAKTWTIGFAKNFQFTKHPSEVQKWAVNVLDRYEAGQLKTSTNAPYWAVGKQKLDSSEVPTRIAELWLDQPSIGIKEFETADHNPRRCVAFSWYLTGILVGRTNFQSTWNPWYLHEIAPGIYAYCGMK